MPAWLDGSGSRGRLAHVNSPGEEPTHGSDGETSPLYLTSAGGAPVIMDGFGSRGQLAHVNSPGEEPTDGSAESPPLKETSAGAWRTPAV